MRKIILLFQLSCICCFAYTQNETIIIKAIDSNGNADSITIGYRLNATVGIDPNLNEIDFYGKPYSEIDIRSIQRNLVLQAPYWMDCESYNKLLPFEQNIDLKEDFRPELTCGNHFIIQVHAINYPITFQIAKFEFYQVIPMTSYKTNGECGTIRDQSADFISEFSKVIFHDSSENELIGLHPQWIDACFNGNKEIKSNEKLTYHINVTGNTLRINSLYSDKKNVPIYNCLGVKIDKINIYNGENTINISTYVNGIYFIRAESEVVKFYKN